MFRIIATTALAGVLVAGCAYDRRDDYGGGPGPGYGGPGPGYHDGCGGAEATGTVVGGVAGGVIGNQFGHGGGRAAATVGGVLLVAIVGNAIARDSCRDERADAYYYNRTYYDAFDQPTYGRRYEWRNPNSGSYGYVTPRREFRDSRGECREFTQEIYVEGRRRPEEANGIACRQPDGTWRIVG
jgi:surface antigen